MLVRVLLAALACAVAPPAAHAEWMVSIGSGTVGAGQQTTVDVLVTGGPERLDYFYTQFRIETAAGGTAAGLQFTEQQPLGFTTDPGSGYVFFNNSGGPLTAVVSSAGGGTGDTLIVGDLTADGLGVDVSTQPRLLARLSVSADSGLAAGTAFRILLIADASNLQDPNYDDLVFSSTAGYVTISGASAPLPSPEPSTAVLLATCIPVAMRWLRVRRRTRLAPPTREGA